MWHEEGEEGARRHPTCWGDEVGHEADTEGQQSLLAFSGAHNLVRTSRGREDQVQAVASWGVCGHGVEEAQEKGNIHRGIFL